MQDCFITFLPVQQMRYEQLPYLPVCHTLVRMDCMANQYWFIEFQYIVWWCVGQLRVPDDKRTLLLSN